MEINEDEKVITPEGIQTEVRKVVPEPTTKIWCLLGSNPYSPSELIKLSEPLRIKVFTEQEAEYVVEYAKDAGFTHLTEQNLSHDRYTFQQSGVIYADNLDEENDLTFSDYDQWTAWVDWHKGGDECNDDSDSWDEPAPENEEYRQWWKQEHQPEKGFNVCDDFKLTIYACLDYIDQLESELESVKEERDELRNLRSALTEELNHLTDLAEEGFDT